MHASFATIVLVPRGQWASPPDSCEREHVFRWAAQAGFEGVEISPRWIPVHELSDVELSRVRQEAAEAGLAVSGLNVNRCLFTRGEEAGAQLSLLRRSIHAAAALSAPAVNISLSMPRPPSRSRPLLHGDEIPESEQRETAERLGELADVALSEGIELSLELHDDGLLDTPRRCLRMRERIGRANVGINPDLGNFIRNGSPGVDWREALRQLAPHTNCWHVKNYCRGRSAPLWKGDVDYAEAVRIMHGAGYAGWVSIESCCESLSSVFDVQEQERAFLKRIAVWRACSLPDECGSERANDVPEVRREPAPRSIQPESLT